MKHLILSFLIGFACQTSVNAQSSGFSEAMITVAELSDFERTSTFAEVLSVASWIGALFVAVYGYVYLQPYARQVITINTTAADAAAGVALFVIALILLLR